MFTVRCAARGCYTLRSCSSHERANPPFTGIAALAASQNNLVTRKQMRKEGYKESAIDRTVEMQVLRRIEHGVFLHGSAEATWRQRLDACATVVGSRGFATAQTALVIHGVIDSTDVLAFAVPYEHDIHLTNATVIRTRRPLRRTRTIDKVRVVSVERALLDAAALMNSVDREWAVENALNKGLTTETRLWVALVEQGGRGVSGSAAFRDVLRRRPKGRPARSVLEVIAGRMLRRAGLTTFVRNHIVALGPKKYELDFAFVAQSVVLEVDGKAFHSTATQVGRDRKRQAALEAAGWRFLRVSWFDVVCEPDRVIRELRALLAA